jgi:hypothetical protein
LDQVEGSDRSLTAAGEKQEGQKNPQQNEDAADSISEDARKARTHGRG